MLNGLDLFSGIGGIAEALEPWVRTVAYCERDRYATAVLLSRMARGEIRVAPIWDNVLTLRGNLLPPIDFISGGFPCQDVSVAGDGLGLEGERSGLFFEIIRLVGDIKPRLVFLENVPAITTRGGLRIVAEFAALGFDCRWLLISAAEAGAPHIRERWFLLAHANSKRLPGGADKGSGVEGWPFRDEQPTRLFKTEVWYEETASKLAGRTNGIPCIDHRNHAVGNGVVPHQVKEAFKILSGIERLTPNTP